MAQMQKVLVLGGGYAGMYTARGVRKHRGSTPVEITVVDPSPYMTYQPLLPEIAGGHVMPRDVTISLKRALTGIRVIRGRVIGADVEAKTVTVTPISGSDIELDYDHVVFAMGAVTRVFPTPGLEKAAVGFKSLEEAVYVRDKLLDNIARAASSTDADERRRALTFVFIGGGYTGVEAIAELDYAARQAVKIYPGIDVSELRPVLIEALDRIAPEVGPELSMWSLHHLRDRGIDIRLKTKVASVAGTVLTQDDGQIIDTDLLVWTAGVQPNPALDDTNAPRGPKGHVVANVKLQVIRDDGSVVPGAWAVGDNAQIPDLTQNHQPAYYPPNAQNALRQGVRLAKNILADIRGEDVTEYRHASLGTIASYGPSTGAALIMGMKVRGFPAWVAHRGYHGLVIPTVNRKIRVFAGWIVDLASQPEVSSLGAIRHPRKPIQDAFAALTRKAALTDKKGS